METTKQVVRRPFHESVVDAIGCAGGPELALIGAFIRTTKIPKDHDEIALAWERRRKELGWSDEANDAIGVLADLLAQKQEVAEKEKEGVVVAL